MSLSKYIKKTFGSQGRSYNPSRYLRSAIKNTEKEYVADKHKNLLSVDTFIERLKNISYNLSKKTAK